MFLNDLLQLISVHVRFPHIARHSPCQTLTEPSQKGSLYERLFVYRGDLRQAAYFAGYLLKKGWHFDPWDKAIRWSTYMQQAAFTSALVTAYCRPFAQTRSSPILPLKLIQYKTNELELHKKLKALRDSVYAHSEG
jgi:hypothetical protein